MGAFDFRSNLIAERQLTLRINVVNQQANAALQQYNTAVSTATANNKDFSDRLVGLNDSFNKFNQTLNTTFMGISAIDVVKFGLDMNRLGQQVNIASDVFEALAGGTKEAADMLELMREKTGGVVDNMALMAGASRLLQMGLADSKEEVAGLTEMAIKLGGALGMDANKAIEDFSLLLSNVSYLRLDQFGISAGAVRARVEELKEEFPELSREARFAKAVLEEGGDAMNRLGTAAGAASTAMSRFETTATNAMQQAAANINYATENFLRFLEVVGELPQVEARAAAELANSQAELTQQLYDMLTADGLQNDADATFIAEFIRRAVAAAAEDPTVWNDMNELKNRILRSMESEGVDMASYQSLNASGEGEDTWRRWLQYIYQASAAIEAQAALEANMIDSYSQYMEMRRASDEEATRQAQAYSNYLNMVDPRADMVDAIAQQLREAQQMDEMRAGAMSGLSDQVGQAAELGGFAPDAHGEMGLTQTYMDQGTATELEDMARFAERQVEYMRELEDARGEAVFSDEDIQAAEEYADQIRGMADSAQDAADALQSASLSDLFGQQGGGRTGEMADAIIQQMTDSGASQEEIDAAQRAFDIGTGRETESSMSYQEDLVPLISEMAETDPAAALEAMQNFNEMMTMLAEQGIDPNAVDAVEHYIEAVNAGNAIDPDSKGDGGEGGDSAYDTSGFDPAAFVETLMEGSEPMSEMATNFSSIKNDSEEFKSVMVTVNDQSLLAANNMQQIANILAQISGHPQEILLIPRIDQHQLHLQLANELSFFQIALR